MKLLKVSLLSLLTVHSVISLDCPDLTCASKSYNGTCFLHNGNNPTTDIRLFECDTGMICNLDDYNYAWFDTQQQRYKTGTDPALSAMPFKYTQAECVTAVSRR
jgi:hypothetical protein